VSLLVGPVQPLELGEHLRLGVGALLGPRARRQPRPLSDGRVRREHLDLLLVRQLVHERPRALERIGFFGEPLDEPGAPLEQLGQLVCGQLPR
jgi:hypothetical protein